MQQQVCEGSRSCRGPNVQLAALADLGKGAPENGSTQLAGAGIVASSGKGASLAAAAAAELRHHGCEERRPRRHHAPLKQSSLPFCFERFLHRRVLWEGPVSDGCLLSLSRV
ncbi:unnamed protein product [Urochloa humidicola]